MWDKRPSCDVGQIFHTEIKAGAERFEQQTQQRGEQVLVPQICHGSEEPRAQSSSSYCPMAPASGGDATVCMGSPCCPPLSASNFSILAGSARKGG